jgi:hypothetical protein
MPNMPYMPGGPIYAMPPQPQTQPRYMVPPAPPQPLVANNLKPKVRAQAPDTPPRIVLPSPEALGIQVVAAKVTMDWNQVHARLEQLGVVNLHRDHLPQGGFRVTLALAGQQVEGTGTTEAAAMTAALERAEALVPRR